MNDEREDFITWCYYCHDPIYAIEKYCYDKKGRCYHHFCYIQVYGIDDESTEDSDFNDFYNA